VSVKQLDAFSTATVPGASMQRSILGRLGGTPSASPSGNSLMRLRRSSFRSNLHPNAEIESIITAGGFVLCNVRETFVWRIVVFSR